MNSFVKQLSKTQAAAWVVCVCIWALVGCGTPDSTRPLGGAPPLSADRILVGDVLQIVFSGVADPPPDHEERIKEDGLINLPYLKEPIKAGGKTRRELEDEIRSKYVEGGYYRRLTVTVKTEQRFFYASGEVNSPNRHPFLGGMTVLQAIAAAGDFTNFADKKEVLVTRANGEKVRVNCIQAQRDPKYDIPIYPEDTIYVPRRLF